MSNSGCASRMAQPFEEHRWISWQLCLLKRHWTPCRLRAGSYQIEVHRWSPLQLWLEFPNHCSVGFAACSSRTWIHQRASLGFADSAVRFVSMHSTPRGALLHLAINSSSIFSMSAVSRDQRNSWHPSFCDWYRKGLPLHLGDFCICVDLLLFQSVAV